VAKQLLIENSSLVYVNGDMTLCETWKTTWIEKQNHWTCYSNKSFDV